MNTSEKGLSGRKWTTLITRSSVTLWKRNTKVGNCGRGRILIYNKRLINSCFTRTLRLLFPLLIVTGHVNIFWDKVAGPKKMHTVAYSCCALTFCI